MSTSAKIRPLCLPVLAGLFMLVVGKPGWAAERWLPDTDKCSDQNTTYAIAECLDARAKFWDRRLNDAYKALQEMLRDQPARLAALKTAQRAWLQYRDANCNFYETEEGTIRLIHVAICNRDMIQARAIELKAASEP